MEVCSAKNLMPKDGQGTASAYAIVDYDGQRRRTKTKFRDLNPQWDEKLEFLVHDVDSMASEILEINLYNDKKTGKRSTFLGKVKISGSTFARSGSELLVYFPLEKRSVFSQIKGEIGLKIYYVDEDPPALEQKASAEEKPPEDVKKEEESKEEVKKEEDQEKKEGEQDEKKPSAEPEPPKADEQKPPEKAEAEAEKPSTENPKKDEDQKEKTTASSDHALEEKKTTANSAHALELRSIATDRRSGGGHGGGSACDLVERMPFLYVRVLKAKRGGSASSSANAYAKLVIGTHSIKTKSQANDKEWDQVFAFDKEGLNSSSLEVSVWTEEEKKENDKIEIVESCLGTVSFDLQEVPKRVPPDSPLAPQWYTLELPEQSPGNDVMLAVWFGTQADEAFQEAWQSDSGGLIPETRAKVYLSPKLWYLRLTVIQTQDLQLGPVPEPKPRSQSQPEIYVKAQHGAQLFKTSRAPLG